MSGVAADYEEYLAAEWHLFTSDLTRQREALAAAGTRVARVLDVGCGGGQDMIPFAEAGAVCIGIDVVHASGVWGARQFQAVHPELRTHFMTSAAEHLPFADGSFDLVVCRVALPYTENRLAIFEIGRVLRPGGVLLLKTHSASYYVRKCLDGVRMRSPLFSLHAIRVLVTGLLYHLTGFQPGGGVLIRETFQSRRGLQRELDECGLHITGELTDSNPLTPSYRIEKLLH